MSEQQISLSPDIQKLVNEGYEVQVRSGHLLVQHVPYLTVDRVVKFGTIVSDVQWAGDIAAAPTNHVAFFAGERPYRANGTPLKHIIGEGRQLLAQGLEVDFQLSSKPPAGRYMDYHEKMTTYVALFEGPAHSVDDSVTQRTFAPVEPLPDDGVFNYWDTAPGSAQTVQATQKLKLNSIGIVGVGGTGSYVLDLVAKCPIKEIHLFDGDSFYSHSAFRSPGAPSIDELRTLPRKVTYLAARYGRMHRRIVPHDVYITATNLALLESMDFVFLCLDRGGDKRVIVEQLERWGKSFIDVGMGVEVKDSSILGIVRLTTSTADKRDHVRLNKRIPFVEDQERNEYSQSIQIADLSALNAALAVIRWKKLYGFYHDLEHEHFCAYTIDGNALLNEDRP